VDIVGLRARSTLLRALRRWFDEHGYLEVPSPVLVPSPCLEERLHPIAAGGAGLRTSPEFALKRAVAAGLPRIYEIGPCFRDRESGPWHDREFTMLEWYRAGAGLSDLMDEVEELIAVGARALSLPAPGPWRRRTIRQLFQDRIGVDPTRVTAYELSPRDPHGWDDAFFRRWVEDIEPALIEPTFVLDWPASQAALAQIRTDGDWPVAQRFEVYLGGIELGNAFLEVVDSSEQRSRFIAANAGREAVGEPPHPVDAAFVEVVGKMPTTAGIAIGLDRLVAVLCGWDGIASVKMPP
jgi:lysyl-tRNA synthetase class 2